MTDHDRHDDKASSPKDPAGSMTQPIARRTFLKGVGVVGAAGLAGALPSPARAFAARSTRTIRSPRPDRSTPIEHVII